MANSVQRDKFGPDWPLGSIVVAVPGTPVSIMSLVDAANTNDPSSTTGDEYTPVFQQIIFQGIKSSAGTGTVNNTGNIYIVRTAVGAGSGNRTDFGSIVAVVAPGQTFVLGSAPANRNMFSPYRYRVDADNANDACQVTGIVA